MKIFALTFTLLAATKLLMADKALQLNSSRQASEVLGRAEWQSLSAAYDACRHALRPTKDGWQAHNPTQQWLVSFDQRGFLARPQDASAEWMWGLELHSYGFHGSEYTISGSPEVTECGQRLTYQWDINMQEWFINDSRGLEHGFTLLDRPESTPASDGRPTELSFLLATRGTLQPKITADGFGVLYQNAVGATEVHYTGLKVWDADGKILPSRFEMADSSGHVRLLVDESGARYPLTIDPIAQRSYLKASNTQAADQFGAAVAVSGDTVVIGANYEDGNNTGVNGDDADNTAPDAGAAYVFVRTGATWTFQAYLKASNTEANDGFGNAVAISGDTIVVGAHGEDSNSTGINGNQANNSASGAGAAYVFTRSGSTWSQQAYLKASNSGADDGFGFHVSISGNTVVVGAPFEDSNGNQTDNSTSASGAAYAFLRIGTAWSQQAYIKASNPGSTDSFGWSLAVDADTLIVGATGEDSNATGVGGLQSNNSADDSGAAYIFFRAGSAWNQQAYLKASNTGSLDRFGDSVAVSGNTVVVGAKNEDSDATGVNGNGAFNLAADAGAAYVFTRNVTTWSHQAYLKASNTGTNDSFGCSVAVSGDTIVVGAEGEDSAATGVDGSQTDESASGAGAAYVFARSSNAWTQVAYLKASNAGSPDLFGSSTALSGNTLICGAWRESSSATGVNGNQSSDSMDTAGAAYIFDLNAAPEIGIEQAAIPVTNGGTKSFGIVSSGSTSDLTFNILSNGDADIVLTGTPKVAVTGSTAFTVTHQPDSPVPSPAGTSAFTVRFAPTTSGAKNATLTIPNNDADENPYILHITGADLSFVTDTDGDGWADAREFLFADEGFNWQMNQAVKVSAFKANLQIAGYYTSSQVHALYVGAPLIQKDPLTGQFKLTLGVEKSTNMIDFTPFPMSAPQIQVNDGKVEFIFTSPNAAEFYKIQAQ